MTSGRNMGKAAFSTWVFGAIGIVLVSSYKTIGNLLLTGIVLGIALYVVEWLTKNTKTNLTSTQRTSLEVRVRSIPNRSENLTDNGHPAWIQSCNEIEQALQRGDYDWARRRLQKIGHSMLAKAVTQDEKKRFTQVMKEYGTKDPRYREVMAIALPYVTANPGSLQSKLYSQLPQWNKEDVRYVLYFANELGHIHRIKKGNSYKLMPANNAVNHQ